MKKNKFIWFIILGAIVIGALWVGSWFLIDLNIENSTNTSENYLETVLWGLKRKNECSRMTLIYINMLRIHSDSKAFKNKRFILGFGTTT